MQNAVRFGPWIAPLSLSVDCDTPEQDTDS